MIELKLPHISSIISFKDGDSIKTVTIASSDVFYNLYTTLRNEEEDSFYLTLNDNKKAFFKNVTIISDLFQLNENDKNNIKLLYKNLEASLTIEQKQLIEQIDTIASKLLFDISLNMNKKMEYESRSSLTDILNVYKYRFSIEDNKTLFDLFLNYVKSISQTTRSLLIISFDFLHFFNEKDIDLLKSELCFFNIKLLDIKYSQNKQNFNGADDLFVDNDLCEY